MISRSQLQKIFVQTYYEAISDNDLANLAERRIDKILELLEQAKSEGFSAGYQACTKEYQR